MFARRVSSSLLSAAAGFAVVALSWANEGDPRETHWSFQPLEKPPVPEVKNQFWVRNPIDAFIAAELEANGLKPVAEADKYTLIRRLTLDLTGLPPTIEEVDAFLADQSEDAYEKLVDRLLNSPHYGERWGRHWLDVARYVQGEIKVPGVDQIDMAAPYRDYVVRSLNADKPYDQFVIEQIAGDLLPGKPNEGFDQLIAPAFLSIGPWFDECPDPNTLRMDIIDEQISVVTQAFLGLNFGCARCHDHKFDPIPTKDYYAMAGIFGSTRIIQQMNDNWRDGRLRLTMPIASKAELDKFHNDTEKYEAKVESYLKALTYARQLLLEDVESKWGQYQEAVQSLPTLEPIIVEAEDYYGQNNIRRISVGDIEAIESQIRTKQWLRYHPRTKAAGVYDLYIRHASMEPEFVEVRINGKTVSEDYVPATFGIEPEHFAWTKIGSFELKERSNDVRIWAREHHRLPRIDQFMWLSSAEIETTDAAIAHKVDPKILNAVRLNHWPPGLSEISKFAPISHQLSSEARVPELKSEILLGVTDVHSPNDIPIHIKGEVYEKRDKTIPRAVPTFAANFVDSPQIPGTKSGRLQLAKWITDPKHPLTARVIANRLWQGHFGHGIVLTPGDLGVQGAKPTNQQLLDWMASTLIENDWSLKSLHREIVTSTTYRLSSECNANNKSIDPENKRLWRYPKHRLQAEAIYDGMLTSIGKVPRQKSRAKLDNNKSKDRAFYILTSSRSPLGLGIEIRKMLVMFGYDQSGVPVHHRDQSTTAEQALFWLNNPLPKYYADKLAEQLLAKTDLNDRQRIERAFRIIVTRPPDSLALESTLQYLNYCQTALKLDQQEAWSRICLGIFSSDAFSYIN